MSSEGLGGPGRLAASGGLAGEGVASAEAYEYALIRVVPRVQRGEAMNAGVILYCQQHRYLGCRILLDEALGSSFAVLGLHVDPAEVLSADATAWWRSLGARSVQVLEPRGAPGPDPGGRRKRPAQPGDDWSVIVEDVDGAFRDWLLKRPADNVIVLRPDRYVAAVCPLGDLEQVTGRLRRILG